MIIILLVISIITIVFMTAGNDGSSTWRKLWGKCLLLFSFHLFVGVQYTNTLADHKHSWHSHTLTHSLALPVKWTTSRKQLHTWQSIGRQLAEEGADIMHTHTTADNDETDTSWQIISRTETKQESARRTDHHWWWQVRTQFGCSSSRQTAQ